MTPIDAAIRDALHAPFDSPPPQHAHSHQRMDVALAPQAVQVRLDGATIATIPAWDTVRTLMLAHYPSCAWPIGLRLNRQARYDRWGAWSCTDVFLFGHAVAPNVVTRGHAIHSWHDEPLGFDALAPALHALNTRIPASNGGIRAFSAAHTLMGTPHVTSRRVVARSEAEALAKFAWVRDGIEGIDALLDEAPPTHRRWLVACELADADHDGFATPASHDDALATLRRLRQP